MYYEYPGKHATTLNFSKSLPRVDPLDKFKKFMVIEFSGLEDRLTSVKSHISDHREELKSEIKNLKITAKIFLISSSRGWRS